MSDELSDAVPDVWLVELTNEQMATFWSVANGYEEAQLGWWVEDGSDKPDDYPESRARLRSLQAAVEQARPIWESTITYQESEQ